MFASTHSSDPVRGLLAGVAAGLVASWVMSQFQAAVPQKTFQQLLGEEPPKRKQNGESDPATVRTAEAISEGVFDHALTKSEKEKAGPLVHFAFGSAVGAVYGVAAEVQPKVTAGFGTLYGTAVWVSADNLALPVLGLAKWPGAYPASTHLYALSSHLVYGLVAEGVRRAVRSLL